ncbi:MAG: Holliday junction branch migration protein RuvA [Planctomycetota bacterium]
MIARLTGTLDNLDGDRAYVASADGGLLYELQVPAYAAARLGGSLGQAVTLYTLLYFESQNQGATFLPRLAGFLTARDKAFYELLVTVKGIGHRRALRAMVFDTPTLAGAILDRDVKLLQTMPEVGKKTAETIVITLRDKAEAFVGPPTPQQAFAAGSAEPDEASPPVLAGSLAREAVEVLVQLGEQRLAATQWVDQLLQQDDAPQDVQAVVAAVYRIKAGA